MAPRRESSQRCSQQHWVALSVSTSKMEWATPILGGVSSGILDHRRDQRLARYHGFQGLGGVDVRCRCVPPKRHRGSKRFDEAGQVCRLSLAQPTEFEKLFFVNRASNVAGVVLRGASNILSALDGACRRAGRRCAGRQGVGAKAGVGTMLNSPDGRSEPAAPP